MKCECRPCPAASGQTDNAVVLFEIREPSRPKKIPLKVSYMKSSTRMSMLLTIYILNLLMANVNNVRWVTESVQR